MYWVVKCSDTEYLTATCDLSEDAWGARPFLTRRSATTAARTWHGVVFVRRSKRDRLALERARAEGRLEGVEAAERACATMPIEEMTLLSYTAPISELAAIKAAFVDRVAATKEPPVVSAPKPRGGEEGWVLCAQSDPTRRRGIWMRTTPRVLAEGESPTRVELCGGREGGDAYVSFAEGDTVTMEALWQLADCLDREQWMLEEKEDDEMGRARAVIEAVPVARLADALIARADSPLVDPATILFCHETAEAVRAELLKALDEAAGAAGKDGGR